MPSQFMLLPRARVAERRAALIALVCVVLAAAGAHAAETLAAGAKNYKPYAVEQIGEALAAGKSLQAAVRGGDVKAPQEAWIKSRRSWEAASRIPANSSPSSMRRSTPGPTPSKAITLSKRRCSRASSMRSRRRSISSLPIWRPSMPSFPRPAFSLSRKVCSMVRPSSLTKSARINRRAEKSPYSGTSLNDIQQNVEGIEAVYKLTFAPSLQARDAKLAARITDKIEDVEKLVKVTDMKSVDQPALKNAGEELAVLLQSAAAKIKLKKPAVGE